MTVDATESAGLFRLADLLKERNLLEQEVATIIGRPGERGHVGEFIASHVFDITLHASATTKGSDGLCASGELVGRSVNIKWYGRQEGLLDVSPDPGPDFYLVLTGPRSPAVSSRLAVRPWVIDHVYLFEHRTLRAALSDRQVKVGVATSIPQAMWEAVEPAFRS